MSENSSTSSIKDRVLREMVSKREEEQSVVKKILNENFDMAKEFFTIREQDGKVTIKKTNTRFQDQVLSYLIGTSYAKVADLREDDGAPNVELATELNVNQNTLGVALMRLRKKGFVVSKSEGIHRIEYRKLGNVLSSLFSESNAKPVPFESPKLDIVFRIYSRSGKEGLNRFLKTRSENQLKDFIKGHRLDASGQSLKWEDKNRLVDLVASRIESRTRHGEVFLEPKLKQEVPRAPKRRKPALGEGRAAGAITLPQKGVIGILEFSANDVRYPPQAFDKLTFEEAIGLLLCEVGASMSPSDITRLVSRGFKKIDPRNVSTSLTAEKSKLKRFVIREGDGYGLTGEGINWVEKEVVPKLRL